MKGYADLVLSAERVITVADQARFTLTPFIVRTRGAQRSMARKLLDRLEGYVRLGG